MKKEVDITGVKNNYLTAVRRENNYKGTRDNYWVCKCDCGKLTIVRKYDFLHGKTKSCGCRSNEIKSASKFKHGDAKKDTPLYYVWSSMRQRCNNSNHPAYKNYGSRGISVCKEWDDYSVFKEWALASGYKKGLSLDRIDNDGNYCPENCKWSTFIEQQNNRRCSFYITYNGITRTATEWSRIVNKSDTTIKERIKRGWSVEDALYKEPLRRKNCAH